MKSFTAGANENDVRLSRFVEGVTKDMPRSMMYKAFRNKRIKVNGKRAEPDTRLKSRCTSTMSSSRPRASSPRPRRHVASRR